MMLIPRFYNNLHEQILKVCDSMALPLHFNKTGYKHFNNYQRVAVIILYFHSKKSLKEFLDDFKDSKWQHYLQLPRIPAKTTLHDWLVLFESEIIIELNKQITSKINPVITAIDGTGIDAFHRSKHYEMRLKQFGINKPKTPHIHLDLWIDTETQMILDFEIGHDFKHDIIGATEIFKRNELQGIEVLADGSYDSEPLHKLIRSKGGKLFAPVRKNSRKKNPKGFYRKKCLNPPLYKGKRSLVETVNSVLKRVQITYLRSKLEDMKNRELAWHIVLYNLKRIISFWLNIFQEKLLSYYMKNIQIKKYLLNIT